MDDRPIQSDARRARRARRLGCDATCALCGFDELEAVVPTRRALIEAHHVIGRANDRTLTVALCRNCHAIVTERLREAGVPMRRLRTSLERFAAGQKARAVLWSALAEADSRSAEEVQRLVEQFDATFPAWRNRFGGDR